MAEAPVTVGRTQRRGLFYGWWIAMASAVAVCYNSGVFYYGFTGFFKPVLNEFGWSRAKTAGAFSLARLEGGLEAPVVGWFIDRVGPRKVMLFGVTIMAIGFIVLSQLNSFSIFSWHIDALWGFYFTYGVLLASGFNAGSYYPGQTAVVNWFRRKRSFALGVISVAGGLGGTIVVPIVVFIISLYGWRNTALMIAVGVLLIGWPTAMVLRHRPEPYGYLPDGEPAETEKRVAIRETSRPVMQNATRQEREVSYTLGETLRTASFWRLTIAFSIFKIASNAVIVHQMPLLLDRGLSEVVAAGAVGFTYLMSIPSRIILSWLGDYWDKRYLITATLMLEATGVGILLFADRVELLYLAFGLWGIGEGRGSLLPALRADYFGPRAFASIQGVYSLVSNSGTVVGPVFAGWVYDVTESYKLALALFVVGYFVAAGILVGTKPPESKTKMVTLPRED